MRWIAVGLTIVVSFALCFVVYLYTQNFGINPIDSEAEKYQISKNKKIGTDKKSSIKTLKKSEPFRTQAEVNERGKKNKLETSIPGLDRNEARKQLAEIVREMKLLKAEAEIFRKNIKSLEERIRILNNPFREKLELLKREYSRKSIEQKPESPELIRLKRIMRKCKKEMDEYKKKIDKEKDNSKYKEYYYAYWTINEINKNVKELVSAQNKIEILMKKINTIKHKLGAS